MSGVGRVAKRREGASLGSSASALYGSGAAELKDVGCGPGRAGLRSRQLREAGPGDRRCWLHVGSGAAVQKWLPQTLTFSAALLDSGPPALRIGCGGSESSAGTSSQCPSLSGRQRRDCSEIATALPPASQEGEAGVLRKCPSGLPGGVCHLSLVEEHSSVSSRFLPDLSAKLTTSTYRPFKRSPRHDCIPCDCVLSGRLS